MRSILFVAMMVSFVGGWATTSAAEVDLKPGMKFEHFFKPPGGLPTQVALPEGTWELASFRTKLNNNSTPLLEAYLFQESEGKLSKFIWFSVATEAADYGYVQSNYCSRDNMHYRETISNSVGGDQDCRWLNHRVQYWLDSKAGYHLAFAQFVITERKLSVPNHILTVGYRLADALSFLQVYYAFNPRMEGFEDASPTKWRYSIWNRTNSASDQKKLAYINRLKSWADEWNPTVKAGFSGKLTGSPKLTPVVTAPTATSPIVKTPQPNVPGEAEERLAKIKELLDKGLLTPDEAAAKRKEILEGL